MSGLKIVADENIPALEHYFSPLGTVHTYAGRSLSRRDVEDADVLLVRSVTSVNSDLLAGSAVRFVGSTTIGVDHLDTHYMDSHSIVWRNAPGSNARSVVEYMISVFCALQLLDPLLKAQKRVGIIGMGMVGGSLYQQLSALGIQCRGYDPLISPDRWPVMTDLSSVLDCDVICLHTPLTNDGPAPSHHLIDATVLERLKPGSVLINAGRGAVVDNAALLARLQRDNCVMAVLDVWENEPKINVRLLDKLAIVTPHIAGYSYDGKLAGTRQLAQACRQWLGVDALADAGGGTREPLSLDRPPSGTTADQISQCVLAAYNVMHDDRRMRNLVGSTEIGSAFDCLRKHYPRRREFAHYRVEDSDVTSDTADYLSRLGFSLGTNQ